MIKILGILFSLSFLILYVSGISFACTCVQRSPQDYFQKADAVFTGKVIKIEGRDITFEVEKSWKLVNTNQITVRDIGEGSCRWGFDVGDEYLMYASKQNDILNFHMCGGMEVLEQAGEHLAFLKDKPTIPLTEKPK